MAKARVPTSGSSKRYPRPAPRSVNSEKLARSDLAALETQGRFIKIRYGDDGLQAAEPASEEAPPHTS